VHLISAGIRSLSKAKSVRTLNTSNVADTAAIVKPPKDPFHAIDIILNYIVSNSGRGDKFVKIDPKSDYPIVCAHDSEEFEFYVRKAGDLKYLEQTGNSFRLSLGGWERLAMIRSTNPVSDKAFVAMWFDQALEEVWQNGFQPAIAIAGFNPIRVDFQQHNGKICDRIIAEIRECAFVVADFTGQRGGVYYEAGYAMGMGKPVIWTVKRSDIPNLHFDTRQYNHIPWDSAIDLRENLAARIRATIPKAMPTNVPT
jgi:hypothetical protein